MLEIQDEELFRDLVSEEMTEKDMEDCVSSILSEIWEDCHSILHEPKYKEIWNDYIQHVMYTIIPSDYEEQYEAIQEQVFDQLEELMPKREYTQHHIPLDLHSIEMNLKVLEERNANLPEQRTEEWYNMRHTILSASSIWKVLHTEASMNQYIYDKCKDIQQRKNGVNIFSPLHWGVRYEPIAQQYYEATYNTTIKEYGCLPHPTYPFLGASPDGINIDASSDIYGRLLEIKCIVNREITGIPKKEYWIQMQMQMECCDIDYCDFLECRFKEYENKEAFFTDHQDNNMTYTKSGQRKGILLVFQKDNQPLYEYMPFSCETKESYETWQDSMMEKHTDLTWTGHIYWYLDEVSCILVERNRIWFQSHLSEFEDVFHTIKREKQNNSFHHRKPRSRTSKTDPVDPGEISIIVID